MGEVIDDNQFDIFQWANWADANKKDLLIDLFIFNKNFTPYVLPLKTSTIEDQMRSLFLYDMINFVETGAAVGLSIRDYATNDQMENVLLYSELESIQRAETLVYFLGDDRISDFNEKEHEMKRMHGIVARFSDPKDPDKTFYIAKQLINKNGAICSLCDKPIETMKDCTIDHIIPISKGGLTTIENCQLAHRNCNISKGNKEA